MASGLLRGVFFLSIVWCIMYMTRWKLPVRMVRVSLCNKPHSSHRYIVYGAYLRRFASHRAHRVVFRFVDVFAVVFTNLIACKGVGILIREFLWGSFFGGFSLGSSLGSSLGIFWCKCYLYVIAFLLRFVFNCSE